MSSQTEGLRGSAYAIVALAALATFGPSVFFDFTGLDDRDLIADDIAFLSKPSSLVLAFARPYMHAVDRAHAYYRPLVTVSYALDAQSSGLRPAAYHATNVALHALASALFLTWMRPLAFPRVVATAAALLFAVHPALAPAVAWIPGRNDSLLAVFALAAGIFFRREPERRRVLDRVLHFGFFALALLTKETAAVLPLVWIAEWVLVRSTPSVSSRSTPFASSRSTPSARRSEAMVYALGWTACLAARFLPTLSVREVALHVPRVEDLSLLAASLGAILAPVSPTAIAVRDDLPVWPGVIAAICLIAAARFIPGVRARVVAFGLTAFVLLMAPVVALGGTLVLGSRLYLPACFVLVAVAEGVRAAAFERTPPVETKLFAAFSIAAAALLATVTVAYEASFRNRRAFAREAVASSPRSALAHFCLGQSEQLDGEDDRALAEYRATLSLGPSEVVHNNIAVIYMHRARWADAEVELREELAYNPRYARAYDNLSIVLRHEGREGEARAAGERARQLEAE